MPCWRYRLLFLYFDLGRRGEEYIRPPLLLTENSLQLSPKYLKKMNTPSAYFLSQVRVLHLLIFHSIPFHKAQENIKENFYFWFIIPRIFFIFFWEWTHSGLYFTFRFIKFSLNVSLLYHTVHNFKALRQLKTGSGASAAQTVDQDRFEWYLHNTGYGTSGMEGPLCSLACYAITIHISF